MRVSDEYGATSTAATTLTLSDTPPVTNAGTPDQAFGLNGLVATDFSGGSDVAIGVVQQSSGKLVVLGYRTTGSPEAIIVRYNSGGSRDLSFGIGGEVSVPFAASQISLTTNDAILVAGASSGFALARFDANGSLDTGFGSSGVVTTSVGSAGDLLASMVVQPDGMILVAGTSHEASGAETGAQRAALLRYTAAGVLDNTFGLGGILSVSSATFAGTPFFDNFDVFGLVLQSDGQMLLGFRDTTGSQLGLARFSSSGVIDSSFGLTPPGTLSTAYLTARAMALQPDGRIVISGDYDAGGGTRFGLIRLESTGLPDLSFGRIPGAMPSPEDGLVITSINAGSASYVAGMEVQANGRILVIGSSHDGSTGAIALARYDSFGLLDTSFFGDGSGIVTTVGSGGASAVDFLIQDDGKIVVVGRTLVPGSAPDFLLVRYLSEPTGSNTPPTADAGGPYSLLEGSSVTLNAWATSDPEQSNTSLTYHWDFDGDGIYDDGVGPQPIFAGNLNNGPGSVTVWLRVTDAGGMSSATSAQINIVNAPPEILGVGNSSPVAVDSNSFIDVLAQDPHSEDVLTYDFDFDNDGVYDDSSDSPTASHVFSQVGSYTVGIRVRDQDGGYALTTTVVDVLPSIRFESAGQQVVESDGSVQLVLRLSQPLEQALTVSLIIDTSTAVENTDYTFLQQSVTFAAGETTASTTLQLINDNTFDPTRTITFGIAPLSSAAAAAVFPGTFHTLTILDDDPLPTVYFGTASQRSPEEVTTRTFTIELSHTYGADVTIPIRVTGSALYGQDYVVANWPVIFNPLQQTVQHDIVIPAGQTSAAISLEVRDDILGEGVENAVFRMLTPINAVLSTTVGESTIHSFYIEASDAPQVNFTVATRPAIIEGTEHTISTPNGTVTFGPTAVTVNVTLTNYTTAPVYIPLIFSGSATLGSDFSLSNAAGTAIDTQATSAVLTAFNDSGSYTFYIRGDNLLEPTENIIITMGTPVGATLGSVRKTEITILDDDVLTVRFENDSTQDVWEDAGTINIPVRLSGSASTDLTVPVVAVAGNFAGRAQEGADFQLPVGSVFFPAGSVTGTLQLKINDDTLPEDAYESLRLQLIAPAGVQVERDPWSSTYRDSKWFRIRDNDPIVNIITLNGAFNGNQPVAIEGGQATTFAFELSKPTNKDVVFQYSVGGNLNAADYSTTGLSPGQTITIPAGSTRATGSVEVAILEDQIAERGENFYLQVSSPAHAIGSQTATIAIIDRDKPNVQFTSTSVTVGHGSSTVLLEIQPTIPLSSGEYVAIDIINPSANPAIRNVEYRLNSTAFNLAAGQTSATLAVEILENSTVFVPTSVIFSLRPGSKYGVGANSQFTLNFLANEAPVAAGNVALSTSVSEPVDLSDKDLGQPPVEIPGDGSNSQVSDEVAVSQNLAIGGMVSDGLVAGSLVYFDANKNRIREIGETGTQTRVDGRFSMTVPAEFDTNQDGFIDASEGQFVSSGGIDGSTGLVLPTQYVAPIGSYVLSPLSTVASVLVNQHGMSTSQAYDRIANAFSLPDSSIIDLRVFQAIAAATAGDTSGLRVFATEASLQDTVTQIASFVASLPDAPPIEVIADFVFAEIAQLIVANNTVFQLANPLQTALLVRSVITDLALYVDDDSIDGVGTIVAAGNQTIQDILEANPSDAVEQIVRAEKTAQLDVSIVLSEVAAGTKLIASAVAETTGQTLSVLNSAAVIGDILPPVIHVTPVTAAEGNAASQMQFVVSISHASASAVSVDFSTADVSAIAGEDYTAVSGTLSWAPGDTSDRLITVQITGDTVLESDEAFSLRFQSVTGALISDLSVAGTIINDDALNYQAPNDSPNMMSLFIEDSHLQLLNNGILIIDGVFSTPLPVSITGGANVANTLTVILSSPGALTAAGINFQGGFAADSLIIEDDTSPRFQQFVTGTGSGSVTVDDTLITYASVESLTVPADINDAPVLTPANPIPVIPLPPLTVLTFPVSTLVNLGPMSATVTDADASDPLGGIAVTAVTGAGAIEYSLDYGITFTAIGTPDVHAAVLLTPDALLRFQAGVPGEATNLVYVAWDQSDGRIAGSLADTTTGPNAFSLNEGSLQIVVTSGVEWSFNAGVLSVTGTSLDDTITVRNDLGTIKIEANGSLINTGVAASTVNRVIVSGLAGDDRLQLDNSLGASLPGILEGGDDNDILIGGLSHDTLEGGEGNDGLDGGAGNDTYVFNTNTQLDADSITDNAGVDNLSFVDSTNDVAVSLALTTAQIVNANLTLTLASATAIENIIGGAGNDTLTGNALRNTLDGQGGNDMLDGDSGDDNYVFDTDTPLGADSITDSDGNDRLTFANSTNNVTVNLSLTTAQIVNSNLTLTLSSAVSIENVFGGSGNDSLIGNTLANTLVGGAGADSLIGGDGNDSLIIDELDISVAGGAGYDRVTLGGTTAGAVTLDLNAGQIEYVWATASNYDNIFDATGATWAVTIYGGSGNDTMIGGEGSDKLYGREGDDTIRGNGGNDKLYGDAGADSLDGGANNDILAFDNDDISVNGGAGFDQATVSGATAGVTLNLFTGAIEFASASTGSTFSNVFNAAGATWAVTIYGGAGDDTIIGGEGNDTLYGRGGNDAISGNGGNDKLYGDQGIDSLNGGADNDLLTIDSDDTGVIGGSGFDRVTVSRAVSSITLDLNAGQIEYVTATASTFDNILDATGATWNVTIFGGSGNDTITGGDGDDMLYGNGGDDVISGNGGVDNLNGGLGADSLDGGADDDALVIDHNDIGVVGGHGFDRVTLGGTTTGAVTLDLNGGQIEYVRATASIFDNVFNAAGATWDVTVYGGSGNDTITGGDGNDTLYGKAGNDTINGGGGNDRLYGDAGADSLDGGADNDILIIDNPDISVIGGLGYDRVTVSGATAGVILDLFTGQIEFASAPATSPFNNVFDATGATWDVTLFGGAGNDVLIGGEGNDTLNGRGGNDLLIGGGGNDKLFGDIGMDTISYVTATASVNVNLVTRTTSGSAGNDTLSSIENVTGSNFDDFITGDTNDNTLDGLDGIDTIFGGGGIDIILNA
ncbi:MAG: hypothetical protein KDB01_15100 [Planctomycetaceae bacterium]|nr:hypothetical protein [Planctomycetaceae bacterium]